MLIISETEDVFIPMPDNLLINMNERLPKVQITENQDGNIYQGPGDPE